ncbi:hypothetical protein GECvBN5_gp080 [Salmonella phage GEC_vB_N5]|uniref:Uncharacterized protein n=2 Tax=Markadamsvirinae TaxID=2732013 RepID=A0A7S9SRU0_9CAUD|nr:hypothetical protein GECvBN3_gp083 [Salmonella phage GEC_vB_N3]QPI15096.1 hypothetical protein GECvBN5_gp080 [Salmonella phage GEC_vB_N5]
MPLSRQAVTPRWDSNPLKQLNRDSRFNLL